MKQLKYGDDSNTLRYEFPDLWIDDLPATLNISFDDTAGGALLAATAATIRTATTLNGDVEYGDGVMTLNSAAAAVSPGDRLHIAASVDGPSEIVECESYNTTTYVVTLKDDLEYDHATGTAVSGYFATYDADLSGDDFTKGLKFKISWIPANDFPTTTELAMIAGASVAASEFWAKLQNRFPVEYEMSEDRDRVMFEQSVNDSMYSEFSIHSLDFNRIVNQPFVEEGILLRARVMILAGAGDTYEYEYGIAFKEWSAWVNLILKNDSFWIDEDQDGAIDEGEAQPRDPSFTIRYA